MVTLTNKNKTVTMQLNTPIKKQEVITKETVYTVVLPEITCNNEDDAIHIHMKVSEFVNTLVRDLLKEEE